MYTLTKGDREIIEKNQREIGDLSHDSLRLDTELNNPNLTEDEGNKISRKIEKNSRKIKRLAEDNEAIRRRAYEDYKKKNIR